MKTLFLVRHGKAQKGILGQDDFERKLNERGKEDVVEMAKRLKKKNIEPEHWISSPAERAFATAKAFAKEYKIELKDIKLAEHIYEAQTADLLYVINQIKDQYNSTILFGHNPAFTLIIDYLTGKDIENLPTSGIAAITFDFDSWEFLSRNTGSLLFIDYPKNKI
jgi:phosphohistidine phosphatase